MARNNVGSDNSDVHARVVIDGDSRGFEESAAKAKRGAEDFTSALHDVGKASQKTAGNIKEAGDALKDKAKKAKDAADGAEKLRGAADKLAPRVAELSKQFASTALSGGNFRSAVLSLGSSFGIAGVAIGAMAAKLLDYIDESAKAAAETDKLSAAAQRLAKVQRELADVRKANSTLLSEIFPTGELDSAEKKLLADIAAAEKIVDRDARAESAMEQIRKQNAEGRAKVIADEAERLGAEREEMRVKLLAKAEELAAARELERDMALNPAEKDRSSAGGGRAGARPTRVDPFAEEREEFAIELDKARRAKFQQQQEEDFIFGTREEQIAREAVDEQERIQRLRRREDAERAAHEAKMDRARREKAAENEAAQRRKAHHAEALSNTQHGVAGLVSIADARRKARVAALAQGATEAQAAEAGRAAALRQTASVLTAIRDRSIVKAIEHTAEGVGALARYDYGSAALHFTSAGIFGGIAGTTAGLAVATENRANSLDRRSGGGALGGGGSGGSGGSGGFGGGGGGGSIPSVPASPEIAFGASRGNTAPTIIFNGPINGSVDKEFVRQITEKQDQLRHERRRTV